MPSAINPHVIINSNGGEITPLMDARLDVAKYSTSCRTVQNMIPRLYGNAMRRPGTEFIHAVRDSTKQALLVPFDYSATDSYVCEFSYHTIRFYQDGALLMEAASASPTGTIGSSGTTVTFSSSATAILAGYHATLPKLQAKLIVAGQTRTVLSWTNATVCVVDSAPSPAWSGDAITSVQCPSQVTTNYSEANLFTLQFKQLNDVMFITHWTYGTATLSRTSSTTFVFAELQEGFTPINEFTGGPFRTRNDILNADSVTMTPSATTGTSVLTSSAFTFQVGHVGALFALTQPRVNGSTTGTATGTGAIGSTLNVYGTFTFHTSGTWSGTVKLQRSTNGGSSWEDYRVYTDRNVDSLEGNETELGVTYRIYVSAYTSGTIQADLTVNDSTQTGIAIVRSIASYPSKTATCTVISAFASTSATLRWAEGEWSDYRGWPRSLTFYQERAVYGGSRSSPQTVWLSATGDYYNFLAGTNADSAFTLEISSDKRQEIQWLGNKEGIAIGTSGGVCRLSGSVNNPVMTPTNYDIQTYSAFECAQIQAVPINESLLFVNRALRHIYDLQWSDVRQEYASAAVTLLCEHLTAGGITDFCVQKNPEPVIWFTTGTSPYLFSISYDKAQEVVAGARHSLGGSGIVESVCRIPGDSEDEIWLLVRRTINGSSVRYIERMNPWAFADQSHANFVDCGLTYDSTPADTFSGLDHLEGETVQILGDGMKLTDCIVASGSITVEQEVSVAHIGLTYTYVLKPMRLDASTLSRGATKRINKIALSFYKTLGAKYGRSNDQLYDVFTDILMNKYGLSDAAIYTSLRDVLISRYGAVAGAAQFAIDWPSTAVFEAVPLFTGDVKLSFDGSYEATDDLIVTGSDPFPCDLLAIVVDLDMYPV